MEIDGFLGFSRGDWMSFFRLLIGVGGVVCFLMVYVVIARWFDRRARKKGGRKQPAWKRSCRSGNNSLNLWDPPLPDSDVDSDD
jgi:hypothetical protein